VYQWGGYYAETFVALLKRLIFVAVAFLGYAGKFALTFQKRNGEIEEPQIRNCTICPPGKYNIEPGSKACLQCDVGKLSAPNRASCQDCKAGEYNFENLRCQSCEFGK
jgi:hypothetical protein